MATNSSQNKVHTRKTPKRDPRYHQLLALAREGNEEAIHDLWVEYHFDFKREGGVA